MARFQSLWFQLATSTSIPVDRLVVMLVSFWKAFSSTKSFMFWLKFFWRLFFIHKGLICKKSALVQVMACHWTCDRLCLLQYVIRPLWDLVGQFSTLTKCSHGASVHLIQFYVVMLLYPPHNKVVGVYICFTPSVCPSVHPSCIPCPLCSAYNSGWIHFIFIHLIKQLQKVCHV